MFVSPRNQNPIGNFSFLMLRLQDWLMGLREEKYPESPHGLANTHILKGFVYCTKNET